MKAALRQPCRLSSVWTEAPTAKALWPSHSRKQRQRTPNWSSFTPRRQRPNCVETSHPALAPALDAADVATVGWATLYPGVAIRQIEFDGPSVAILEQLSTEARLLVVGRRGRGSFDDTALGTTSSAMIRKAHCPVIVASEA